MDIMELGAIGELVGGIAVIGTLLFVGLQLRQTAGASRAAVVQDALLSAATSLEHISNDPDRSALFFKGMRNLSSLTREEFAQFHLVLGSMCRRWEAVIEHRRHGTLDELTWAGGRNVAVGLLRAPGFREWWMMMESAYNPIFGEFVRTAHSLEEDPEWSTGLQAFIASLVEDGGSPHAL